MTAGVLWGPFQRETLEAERPDHLFDRPAAVLSLLEGAHDEQDYAAAVDAAG